MKKKSLQLIILLAVFVLIMAAYLISLRFKVDEQNDTEPENQSVVLVDRDPASVTSISYTKNGETVNLTADASSGTYVIDDEAEFPLDKAKADEMVWAVSNVECIRLVEDTRERFADYGLDDPEYVITAAYDARTLLTMNFGDINDFTDSRYMNVEGTNKVYLVSPSMLDPFDYTKLQLVSHDTKPAIGSDEITGLEIIQDNRNRLEYTRSQGQWSSGPDGAVDEQQLELMIRAVTGITLTKCADYGVNEDSELEKYGLLTPTATVTVTYEKENAVAADTSSSSVAVKSEHSFTVLIGNLDDEKEARYIKLPDSELVYKADAELISPLITDNEA